jgi:AraC-like DNA-binding protein
MRDAHPARLALPPLEVRCGTGVHGPGTERFRMANHWQLHVYSYSAELTIGAATLTVNPGTVTLIPPGVPSTYRFPNRVEHRYAHFRLGDGEADAVLPLVIADPIAIEADLAEVMAWQFERPAGATACFWRMLWKLAAPCAARARPDTVVRAATAHLEAHLGESLRVAEVAAVAGVSHNQLIRLFRARLGTTPLAWLQRRRAETAAYLIRSTDRSLGSIASEVGLPDRQHFNKVIRRCLGCAPSRLRNAPGTSL